MPQRKKFFAESSWRRKIGGPVGLAHVVPDRMFPKPMAGRMRRLGQEMGVSVLFMTANPGMVREGVAGTIGVLSKPTDERAVQTAVEYALRRRHGEPTQYAPPGLQLFG